MTPDKPTIYNIYRNTKGEVIALVPKDEPAVTRDGSILNIYGWNMDDIETISLTIPDKPRSIAELERELGEAYIQYHDTVTLTNFNRVKEAVAELTAAYAREAQDNANAGAFAEAAKRCDRCGREGIILHGLCETCSPLGRREHERQGEPPERERTAESSQIDKLLRDYGQACFENDYATTRRDLRDQLIAAYDKRRAADLVASSTEGVGEHPGQQPAAPARDWRVEIKGVLDLIPAKYRTIAMGEDSVDDNLFASLAISVANLVHDFNHIALKPAAPTVLSSHSTCADCGTPVQVEPGIRCSACWVKRQQESVAPAAKPVEVWQDLYNNTWVYYRSTKPEFWSSSGFERFERDHEDPSWHHVSERLSDADATAWLATHPAPPPPKQEAT